MGISCSCPFAEYNDLENGFEAVIVKSISFNGDSVKTALRSISFNGRDSEPAILKSLSSGRMILEGSVSFKSRELQTMISIKAPSSNEEKNVIVKSISFNSREIDNPFVSSDGLTEKIPQVPVLDPSHPKHEAALKLQKVYKSFRTRRKLADCAVLVEQRWWKLLDFLELKRSSISFFDIEKHETAVSRWSRARTRAAKVGKGLSKDNKAQKLALQHWLEAIDPRHRYGHNLHFYYVKWLHCESRQPFFYWLDIGEGKEVNLDRCPRSRLQQQCIKYLGPTERKEYEVTVENGKFLYKQTGELLNTCGGSKDAKWIFVLSTTKTLYVGQKNKGKFQHSSFLAGGATSAAGRLVVENGMLKAVWPHSGHYRPTEENFQEFVTFLKDHDVDLTDVKKNPTDEEEESLGKHGSTSLRINFSEQNLTQEMTDLVTEGPNTEDFIQERTDSMEQDNIVPPEQPKSRLPRGLDIKLSNLAIPKRTNAFETSDGQCLSFGPSCSGFFAESPHDCYETPEEPFLPKENCIVSKRNMFDEDQVESVEEIVPQESILHRISSHKRMESYQLGKQLSFKWTTGAGPRIGCVRDYPSELQFLALEQVNLSPRKSGNSRGSPQSIMGLSPKVSTPTPLSRETTAFTKTNLR